MQSTAIRKTELKKKIAQLPEKKLSEVEKLVKQLLSQTAIQDQKPVSLEGIWKDKGFEKIADIEAELQAIRQGIADSISKRDFSKNET